MSDVTLSKEARTLIAQKAAALIKNLPHMGSATPLAKADRLGKSDVIKSVIKSSEKDKIETAKDLIMDRGTGTLIDIPVNLARILPPVKKVLPDDKYRDLLYAYQSKIVDADRAAGKTVAGGGKFLKKLVTTTDMVPEAHVITEGNKVVQAYVPKEVERLSAPIDKAKNLALPLLTLYGVDSVVKGSKEQTEPGDHKTAGENDLRNILVEKVAKIINTLPPVKNTVLEKIAQASDMLKQASDKISHLEADNEHLASEVDDLKLKLFAKERSRKAVKLANDMTIKGLIKQSAVASQVDYIMGLDEDGFNVLNKTVGDVPVQKTAVSEGNGVDKISCLLSDPYTDTVNELPSLEDAIMTFSK